MKQDFMKNNIGRTADINRGALSTYGQATSLSHTVYIHV